MTHRNPRMQVEVHGQLDKLRHRCSRHLWHRNRVNGLFEFRRITTAHSFPLSVPNCNLTRTSLGLERTLRTDLDYTRVHPKVIIGHWDWGDFDLWSLTIFLGSVSWISHSSPKGVQPDLHELVPALRPVSRLLGSVAVLPPGALYFAVLFFIRSLLVHSLTLMP